MLLPGYYLKIPDANLPNDDGVLNDFIKAHPSWAQNIDDVGPWVPLYDQSNGMHLLKGTQKAFSTIVVARSLETTMEYAYQLVQKEIIGEWDSVITVEQTSGRGQLRRPWVSLPGNLHASVVLPPSQKQGKWSRAAIDDLRPLIMGYVFCEVLLSLGSSLSLKWPNDLIQGQRKVGGMLIEERNGTVVLGLGLNLVESPAEGKMREHSSVSAGVLQMTQHVSGPLGLWETLVNRGKNVYAHLLDDMDPFQFVSAVSSRLAWLGQAVVVRDGGEKPYQAIIVGLTPSGGLLLQSDNNEIELRSGSIARL